MSTPNTYGLTQATYGVTALTGFVVQSSSLSVKPGVAAEIHDETGVRVHSRYDDNQTEISLEMIVNGGAIPVPGTVLTYNLIKYEIQSVDVKGANKDFTKVSVKAKTSPGIVLTTT